MTQEELERTMRMLEPMYDLVRVVDPSLTEGCTLNGDGHLDTPHTCFNLLNKGRRCKNCISARCVSQKRSVSKFEFVGNDAFYISTRYAEVDDRPVSIELVKRLNDDTLVSPLDVNDRAMDELQNLSEKTEADLFIDKVTGTFNRHYLEDGIVTLRGSKVAMMRLVGLDRVAATLGNEARDVILSSVANVVTSSIREADTLIHYDDDTFVIIFEVVPRDVFPKRLEEICQKSHTAMAEHAKGIETNVVMGAIAREATIGELTRLSREALDKARAQGVPLLLVDDQQHYGADEHGRLLASPALGVHAQEVDALTGLPQPRIFRNRLQDLIDHLGENDAPLRVIHFDIENFKAFNRTHGLPEGDILLVDFAVSIRDAFAEDLVTRTGIDKFVVATNAPDFENRIASLVGVLQKLRRDVTLELKCGVYEIYDNAIVATRAMDAAKIACDSIKGMYDQTVRAFDDELHHHVSMKEHIVKTLDTAIEENRICPYYQAIVRSFTGKACHMEALARWTDPTYNIISPADVIPTLERAHLIHKHDTHIVRCVCRDMRDRLDKGLPVVPVSVNLSRLDFELCDIFEAVEDAVKTYDIDRSLIAIEVTESTLDKSNSVFRPQIERFRQAGYEIWMDDFGSGYSSLNLLKEYNFDVLKIDMAFLRGLEDNPNSREILSSIVDMAKRIGLRTLTEGVENENQYAFLKNIGCEMIQGYLFSRPAPYERLPFELEHLPIEDVADRHYLDSVGRVNLLSQQPAEAVNPTGSSSGLPLAIIDWDGSRFTYFTANEAYVRELASLGFSSTDEAEAALNTNVENARKFTQTASKLIGTHVELPVMSLLGDISHHAVVQYVAKSDTSAAFLVSSRHGVGLTV